jgi:hypothetical protein
MDRWWQYHVKTKPAVGSVSRRGVDLNGKGRRVGSNAKETTKRLTLGGSPRSPERESNETDMPDAHSRLADVCLRDAAKHR